LAQILSQIHARYDQLVYPLIFWTGCGGCGFMESDEGLHRVTSIIRRVLICLLFQPRDHLLQQLTMLREEFICALSERLSNIQVSHLINAERQHFTREDESMIRCLKTSPKNTAEYHSSQFQLQTVTNIGGTSQRSVCTLYTTRASNMLPHLHNESILRRLPSP
jgi:hypothetical protein